MARGTITVTALSRAGVSLPTATTGDATNGHQVANNGRVILVVQNSGSTVARTVTFRLYPTHDGQALTPRTKAIPVSTTQYFGPFPNTDYGDLLLVDVDNAELKIQAIGY